MYIQHSNFVTSTENINVESHNISERLKVYATRLKKVEPYKTVKRGEPTMPTSNISESVSKQLKRGIIHTLARMTRMANVLDHQSKKCHLLMDSMQVLVNLLL